MLKNLFSNKKRGDPVPETPSMPSICDLTLGRAVIINDLVIEMLGADANMYMNSTSFKIVAQGILQFEDGQWLHRFYGDDDEMLQIMGGDGLEDQTVSNITLFMPWHSEEPNGDHIDQELLSEMKKSSYETGGAKYERTWFEGEGEAEPVTLVETITKLDGHKWRINQHCMQFERKLNNQQDELLLVIHEVTEGGDESYTEMVGLELSRNDFTL